MNINESEIKLKNDKNLKKDNHNDQYENLCMDMYGTHEKNVELKFPTFDEEHLDNQLKSEITYNSLMSEIHTTLHLLFHFDKEYELLHMKNKEFINSLIQFNINYLSYKLYGICLHRLISLIHQKLMLKFETKERKDSKDTFNANSSMIENDYISMTEEELIKRYLNIKNDKTKEKSINNNNDNNIDNNIISINDNNTDNTENKDYNDPSLINIIKKQLEFEKEILNQDHTPSITSISIIIKTIKYYLEKIIDSINLFYELKESFFFKDQHFLTLYQNCTNLEILLNALRLSYKDTDQDLFNLPEDCDEWVKLKKNIYRRVIFSCHGMKQKMKDVFDFVILGNAAVSKGQEFTANYLKILGTSFYFAYFFFNSKKAKIQSQKYSLQPNFDVAKKVWNLLDTGGIKNLNKLYLPRINYRRSFYLKKMEIEINIKFLTFLKDHKIKDFQTNKNIILETCNKKPDIISEYNAMNESNNNTNSNRRRSNSNLFLTDLKSTNEKDSYVKVKLLFSNDLYMPKINSRNFFTKYFSCCSGSTDRNFTRNAIIIHVHGGGWVAMSSSSHENYLRKWVNGLEVPCFSIDYSLSPEAAYPVALNEVWQAYNWIIKNATDEFQLDIDKVILVGDSAGGNLVLGLIYLLILLGKRVPDALFLAYPGVRVSLDNFSPSSLLCLKDQIIPYQLLKYCIEAYKQDYNGFDDPFLNPILMSDNVLRCLPIVRIIVGSSDPLRDEIIKYVNILTYELLYN